jgi:hypothetical protein
MGGLQIQEINHYINPYSILVVTPKKIVRLYCPFRVQVIRPVGELQPDQLLEVHKVQASRDRILLYVIGSNAYYHYHFMIIV